VRIRSIAGRDRRWRAGVPLPRVRRYPGNDQDLRGSRMKKVSRGTLPLRELTRGNVTTYYRLRPAYLAAWERDALAAGTMTAARWPVLPENSYLPSGSFAGLDFSSGRAVRGGPQVELRCRHRFAS